MSHLGKNDTPLSQLALHLLLRTKGTRVSRFLAQVVPVRVTTKKGRGDVPGRIDVATDRRARKLRQLACERSSMLDLNINSQINRCVLLVPARTPGSGKLPTLDHRAVWIFVARTCSIVRGQ